MITKQIPVTYSSVTDVVDAGTRSLTLSTGQVMTGVGNQLKGDLAALNVKTINIKAFP